MALNFLSCLSNPIKDQEKIFTFITQSTPVGTATKTESIQDAQTTNDG